MMVFIEFFENIYNIMCFCQCNMEIVQYFEFQVEEIIFGVWVYNGVIVDELNVVIVWLKKFFDNVLVFVCVVEVFFDEIFCMVEGGMVMYEQMNKNQYEVNVVVDEGYNEYDVLQQWWEVQLCSIGVYICKNEFLVFFEGMYIFGRIQGLIDVLGFEFFVCLEISFEGMGDVEVVRKQVYFERKSYMDKILYIKKRDGYFLWQGE